MMKQSLLVVIYLCGIVTTISANKLRKYYIAAVEVEWDYVPSGNNLVDEKLSNFHEKTANGADKIGKVYKKVIYKRFNDSSFTTEIPSPKWMGLLGPTIRAEIGDTIQVHFKNTATGANFSVHPHGVLYDKYSEGALYLDNTANAYKSDDRVPPGGSYIYTWNVTQNFAPSRDDDNCLAWSYHSHTNPEPDINTGLVGVILTCKNGVLTDDGEQRTDGYTDLILYAENFLELLSWKISDNLNKCGAPSTCQKLLEKADENFDYSNTMPALNGLMFGNLNFEVTEGEKIAWHFMGLSTGLHSISILGQTFIHLGRRTDTISIYPATFITTKFTPINAGKWLIFSRNRDDFLGGMSAFLTVIPGTSTKPIQKPTHTYYISAEEVTWDYGPSGIDKLTGKSLLAADSQSSSRFQSGPHKIGGIYKKARYFEYTDSSFKQKINQTSDDNHLGILGPVLRVAVGEIIEVVFKNFASRQYSFMPFGVSLEKAEEGALYLNHSTMEGKIAQPGENITYLFTVPYTVSPTTDDPQCLTYTYQSAVDIIKDVNTGLIGPLLVCKSSRLTANRKQRFVDKEFHLLFQIFDENDSWYIDENIQTYASDPAVIDRTDSAFIDSNTFNAINGLSYGNIKGLDMCIGDMVSWHVSGLGNTQGLHGVHFDGNTLQIDHTNKDSEVVIPGTSFTGIMTPDNIGSWQVICRTNDHFLNGMTGLYHVNKCDNKFSDFDNLYEGLTRTYYIAAVEIDWDFAPSKVNILTGNNLTDPNFVGNIWVRDTDEFIGTTYKKAVFREFTDSTFTFQKQRTESENHLGVLGPIIRAEVMDKINVVFKNMASRPYSIHPQGVLYKNSDAGYDMNNTSASVQPGHTYTYKWEVPRRAGPTYNDPTCIAWVYYSIVDSVKDYHSGLAGPLIVCAKGYLDSNGKRKDVDHEFALLFSLFNEGESWYIQQNVKTFAPNRTDLNDPDFVESNTLSTINGYIFGNVPDLKMSVNQKIAWYILGLGGDEDYHTVHFHAETFLHRSNRVHRGDVMEIFPSVTETVEMYTDNPGTWIVHCHLGDHVKEGMMATYTILPHKIMPNNRTAGHPSAGTGSSAKDILKKHDLQQRSSHGHMLGPLLRGRELDRI